jgi:hypothetical protein
MPKFNFAGERGGKLTRRDKATQATLKKVLTAMPMKPMSRECGAVRRRRGYLNERGKPFRSMLP